MADFVYCFGCGQEINKSSDRYNMYDPACNEALPIWKRMATEELNRMGINDEDVESLLLDKDGRCIGRMCRKCPGILVKFEKLKISTEQKIRDALSDHILTSRQSHYEQLDPEYHSEAEPLFHHSNSTQSTASPPVVRPYRIPNLRRQQCNSSTSPDVTVIVRKPNLAVPVRTTHLTPRRRKAGAALARSSMRTLVNECFSDERAKKYVTMKIGRIIRTEIKKLSTMDSILCSQLPEDLRKFDIGMIYKELEAKAPFLHILFLSATKTRTPCHNQKIVISVCLAVLLKYRFKRMNIFQRLLSLILYAGQCSKDVFSRLSLLELTVSYPTVLRMIDNLGINHDEEVKMWRDDIINNQLQLESLNLDMLHFVTDFEENNGASDCIDHVTSTSSNSSDSSSCLSSCSSDEAPPPYSPISNFGRSCYIGLSWMAAVIDFTGLITPPMLAFGL